MNEIKINKLQVFAYHGVNEEEKNQGQRFFLNIKIKTSFQNTLFTDEIDETIHYGHVSKDVVNFFVENRTDLIESICQRTINMLFIKYPQIKEVEIEVVKPWAPIKLQFDSVAVKACEKKEKVYIAIGGNIGDTNKYFDEAIKKIAQLDGIYTARESSRIISRPYGGVEQDNYINSVLEIETMLSPAILLKYLQEIEIKLDRKREVKWGARTIDLDIILYGNEIISQENLLIPHMHMNERDFVLKPLYELNPYLLHPISKKTIFELINELDNTYIKE